MQITRGKATIRDLTIQVEEVESSEMRNNDDLMIDGFGFGELGRDADLDNTVGVLAHAPFANSRLNC